MKAGALIKRSRLRAGLTQAELADRMGTVQPVIARWERGTRSPSFETFIKAIRACGFTPRIELEPFDPGEEAMFQQWQTFSPLKRLRMNEVMLELERWARTLKRVER